MAIKDNRTLIVPADNENNFLDTGGGASATDDPDVFYYNSPGRGQAWNNNLRSLVYDFGSGTEADLTDKHIFLLVNCGVVGLLQTRALGGFRQIDGICVKLYRYQVKPIYSCPLFESRENDSDPKQCQYCRFMMAAQLASYSLAN